jgi:hypothetical protein
VLGGFAACAPTVFPNSVLVAAAATPRGWGRRQ